MMGGYSVLREDDEKHSCTHIVLTVDEYNKLVRDKKSLQSQLADEQSAHKRDVDDITARANAYKKNADKAAQEEVDEARQKVAEAEAERDRQTNLNNNLLRITRERANSKRGLQPKKEHHGYRFSGKIMQTKTICGHDKKEGAIYTDVWTAILETPYDGTIPIHQIEDKIFADLKGEEGILKKLYINYWTFNGSDKLWKGNYVDAVDEKDNPEKKNYLFDYKFMVNPKTRLWEVQITTTKSIRALAEMMG